MTYLNEIYDYIKRGEATTQNLGLEIEHFVLNEKGVQIPFDEISPLIEQVGQKIGAEILYIDGHPAGYATEKYTITLEPSCQFEISVSPYAEIAEIEKVYTEFLNLWEPIFEERGYRIETKGNLPLVEIGSITPEDIPLSPKKRYEYMDRYFKEISPYGRYMMRASTSTQVSVDYSSEQDLVRKLTVLQKIAPIFMILMENKTKEDSTLPGHPNKPHLLRIQEWDLLDPDRTGFFPHSFDPDFGYAKIADVVYHTPLILLTDEGKTTWVGHKSAADLVEEGILSEENVDPEEVKSLVEHFFSMGFFHFRVKKYIEIRVADSGPIQKSLGYAALIKGLLYSEQNLHTLETELSEVNDLSLLQEAVEKIERDGRDAVIYLGKTADQWISYLKQLAEQSLPEREKVYLKHV